MKKIAFTPIFALMIAGSLLQSCSKIQQALTYDIPMQTGTIKIQLPPVASESAGYGVGFNSINVDSVIKASTANLLGVGNVRSIKLTAATMLLSNADAGNNFQNFSSCFVSFSTNESPQPYQITMPNNPNIYETIINMPVDTAQELKGYINGNQFTYSAGGQVRTATTTTLNCVISLAFKIEVHE